MTAADPASPGPVPLKDATLEQIVQAISAKIEGENLNYPEELAAASKNIKKAISRINYTWNLQNSPILRLPDILILHIFGYLQDLAYKGPLRTHTQWWEWLKVVSVCRAWWRISIEGSSLWENIYILFKMPVSFLHLILDRAGGRMLAIHLLSCDVPRDSTRCDGYLRVIEDIAANRIRSLAIHVTPSAGWRWKTIFLPRILAITYPILKSLDLSYDAFYASSLHTRGQNKPLYRPDIREDCPYPSSVPMHLLIAPIPWDQLNQLTFRHMKGWSPTPLRNLTHLTLFGYADGTALAEVVLANPALQKLRLESIKDQEKYSYDPNRLVSLKDQALELVRCDPDVLSMFSLSPMSSLAITRTMNQGAIQVYEEGIPVFSWLPRDVSEIRCLELLEELQLSIIKVPGRRGWIAAEQKTVGYSASIFTSGSKVRPSVIFTLTYHYDTSMLSYKVPFEPAYLLPQPILWDRVTHASLDGFDDKFNIRDNTILGRLQNLRSLTLRHCASDSLVRFITPGELQVLEILRLDDKSFGAEAASTLFEALRTRRTQSKSPVLQLKVFMSGHPNSVITMEQIEKLKECIDHVEVA